MKFYLSQRQILKKNDRTARPNPFARIGTDNKSNGTQSSAPNTALSAKEETADVDPLGQMKSGMIIKK